MRDSFRSLAYSSASSNACSTFCVNREYASILITTIEPYPFLVKKTGSPPLTTFSISVNLFRKSETGLMAIIYNSFNSVASSLVEDSYGFLSGFGTSDLLPEPDDEGFLGLNYLVKYLETMPTFLILMGACWVINLILIGRIFEIVVYTAVSPIPLATFAAEGWHDTAKGFIKSYAAVCLQGLVVVMMFYSFSQVVDLLGGTSTIGITIVALSLALGVAKSGQWARQALGCV